MKTACKNWSDINIERENIALKMMQNEVVCNFFEISLDLFPLYIYRLRLL